VSYNVQCTVDESTNPILRFLIYSHHALYCSTGQGQLPLPALAMPYLSLLITSRSTLRYPTF